MYSQKYGIRIHVLLLFKHMMRSFFVSDANKYVYNIVECMILSTYEKNNFSVLKLLMNIIFSAQISTFSRVRTHFSMHIVSFFVFATI